MSTEPVEVRVRPAVPDDLEAIREIYNNAVASTTAIWNETQVDLANRRAWYEDRLARGYPVLVAEAEGSVLGYASFGDFRPFEGYRFTVEHSVYVRVDRRSRGIGGALMPPLIEAARAAGKRAMIGGIAAENEASIRLHEKFGFEKVGLLPGVGVKFGRLLDLLFMQKTLVDPAVPPG